MDPSLVQALLHPSVYLTINVTMFVCGVLVLMMQPGFTLLEAGSVSRKNAINNVFKNVMDMCLCGLFFWWIGFDILMGESIVNSGLAAIGLTHDVIAEPAAIQPTEPVRFFFQLVFACTAVTITSGCVTGRVRPFHYLFYSIVFSALVYPTMAFLVWHPEGAFYGIYRDFAGASVVHALGGFAGLTGAIMLRPRIGFFRHGAEEYGAEVVDGLADSHQPHNIPLAALGVFLLWIGWFGYNAGTLFSAGVPEFTTMDGGNVLSGLEPIFDKFGDIIANTFLAPCAAVCMVVAIMSVRREELDMLTILNAAIAGLVAITGAVDVASPVGAIMIGMVSGAALLLSLSLLERLRIDDPVGAFPAHGVSGLIGVIAVAFFPLEGETIFGNLVSQTTIGLIIVATAVVSAFFIFTISQIVLRTAGLVGLTGPLKPGYGKNMLRVAPEIELDGLDLHLHGRDAYNIYDNV